MRIENFNKSLISKKAEWATAKIEGKYHLRISNPGNIVKVKNYLRQYPESNLLLYFNHITFPDPVFIYWLYQKYLDPALSRQVILPASHLHTKFTYNPGFAFIFNLGKFFYGYQGVRVIQSYMVNDQYSSEEAMQSYRGLIKIIKEFKQQKPISLLLAPEGHRSDDGLTLQRGDEGIISLAKMLAPVVLQPVGINYPERSYQRSGLNFGQQVNLNIANFMAINDRHDPVLNQMKVMRALASALPSDMQGIWAEQSR